MERVADKHCAGDGGTSTHSQHELGTQTTNPFTSDEIQRRLANDNPESGETNPFASDEIRQRLAGYSKQFEGINPSRNVKQEQFVPTSIIGLSEDRKSLTNVANKTRSKDRTPASEGLRDTLVKARLVLRSAQPNITAKLLEGMSRNRQLDFRTDALPGNHVLAVDQEPDRIHVAVAISDSASVLKIAAAIYFDPGSDMIILQNVAVVAFGLTPEGIAMTNSHLMSGYSKRGIGPGTWSLHVQSGGGWLHVVQIVAKPRNFFTLDGDKAPSANERFASATTSHGKRTAGRDDEAGDSIAMKRQRGKDGTAIDIILRPPAVHAANARSTITGRTPTTAGALTTLKNPLLNMKEGEMISVENPSGAVYTLIKDAKVRETRASLVFRAAKSDIPNKPVAVKVFKVQVLDPNTATNTTAQYEAIIGAHRAMEREVKAQSGLKHDKIVELYDMDTRLMALYLEYVEGPSLDTRGSWCRLPGAMFSGDISDAQRAMKDIASALRFLHSKGIVHNDIKPGNVLYSRERGAVVCDLGLASSVKQVRDCGTPWYVSPENRLPNHRRVEADDWWALGITGLYLLRTIPLPELSFGQWQIAKMATELQAAAKAEIWFRHVEESRARLEAQFQLSRDDPEYPGEERHLVQSAVLLTSPVPEDRLTGLSNLLDSD